MKPLATIRVGPERALSIGLGLSLIAWAFAGWFGSPAEEWGPLRLLVSMLNLCVGGLLLFRREAFITWDWRSFLTCLPSLVAGGALFKLAQPFGQWGVGAACLFAFGAVLTVASFLMLGRNFGIFPAYRGMVSRGLYAWVRHPAYLGETLMCVACFWAVPQVETAALMAAYLPLMALRIIEEERVLSQEAEYRQFQGRVRWRMLPGLW